MGAETDAQGRFELSGLLPGTYDLSVEAWRNPRATPAKPTVVEVPKGKDATGIRIEMPATGLCPKCRGRLLTSPRHAWYTWIADALI